MSSACSSAAQQQQSKMYPYVSVGGHQQTPFGTTSSRSATAYQPAQPRTQRKISHFIGSRGYFILDLRPGILQIGSVQRGGPNANTTMCPIIYTRYTLYCPIRIPSEVYLTAPDIYILCEVTSLPPAPAGGLTLAPAPWDPGLGQWRSGAELRSYLLCWH